MNEHNTDKLADLIDKRHRCLSSLRDLSTMQSSLIADGNMPALFRTFAAKNQWIVGLQSIERELAPFHAQDAEQRVWSSQQKRQECAEQASACKKLLEEVMKLEVENEQAMTHRRDQVADQLQSAHSAGAARAAYQSHSDSVPPRPHVPSLALEQDVATNRLDLKSEAS